MPSVSLGALQSEIRRWGIMPASLRHRVPRAIETGVSINRGYLNRSPNGYRYSEDRQEECALIEQLLSVFLMFHENSFGVST